MEHRKVLTKEKNVYIEFLRIMAAFLVIVNHTNSVLFLNSKPSALWFTSITYFFISKTAVPIFIMITGAVMLKKQDNFKKYCFRIARIALVIAIFSCLAHLYYNKELSLLSAVKIMLKGDYEPHWYLYLYLGILIILPILQKVAKLLDKKELIFLIAVSAVAGVVPMLQFIGFKVNDALLYGMISPYIGMMFAGYYVENYANITGKKAFAALGVFVLLIIFQVFAALKSYYTHGGKDYLWMDNAKFVTIYMSALCIFIMIKYVFSKYSVSNIFGKCICYIGSLTFGIYLIADFVKDIVYPLYSQLSNILPEVITMVIFELAIFAIAALITCVLKLIPIVKKII